MNARLLCLVLVLALAASACAKGASGTARPGAQAAPFADLTLAAPSDPSAAAYLGLSPASDTFRLSEIKGSHLLVQVFSAYCPHCQAEAPHMVELFEMVRASGLGDKLKIIGIGPNNTDFEVKLFRDKYAVPFPLIPDPEMRSIAALGKTPTPTYLILKLNGAGTPPSLLDKEVGRFSSAQDFFAHLRETTGL